MEDNNYILCLEAAGIVPKGLHDEDYQDYLKGIPYASTEYVGILTYDEWKDVQRQGERHRLRYKWLVEPYFQEFGHTSIPEWVWEVHRQLMKEIAEYEFLIGA